jgi:hypothetical protein
VFIVISAPLDSPYQLMCFNKRLTNMAYNVILVKEFLVVAGLETSVPHVLACSYSIFNAHHSLSLSLSLSL